MMKFKTKKAMSKFLLSVFCIAALHSAACAGKSDNLLKNSTENADAKNTDVVSLKDLTQDQIFYSDGDFVDFTYEDLKKHAVSIVKAEVTDELTSENSMSHMDEDGYVTSFCSVRTVKLLDVYQDSAGYSAGDEIKVQDWSAIFEENGEMHMDSYGPKPLIKGDTYILYLENGSTMSGSPCIISGFLGQVNLNALSAECENYNILVKTIVEFESDLSDSVKKTVLSADEIQQPSSGSDAGRERLNIETASGDLEVDLSIDDSVPNSLKVTVQTNE